MNDVRVREFVAGDEAAFRRLNEEWITRYFKLEPKDEVAFANPRETVIAKGGKIFFAERAGEAIGCCALVAMGAGADGAIAEFEVAKMAVTASAQGLGVGRLLLERVVAEARAAGAKRLFLETNSALTPAIRLYESVGFEHVPSERVVAPTYARVDVVMEMWVSAAADSK